VELMLAHLRRALSSLLYRLCSPVIDHRFIDHRSEIKATTQNHLGNQVIGRAGEAHAETEIDLPLRSNIQINCRKLQNEFIVAKK
jgi:hypothetical protein